MVVTSSRDWIETVNLHPGDIVVIVGYFIVIIGVGIWSSCKSKSDSVSGYFLASRNMHWIPVGASLFASNIGSGHFIGLAGSGAASGVGIAGFELNAVLELLALGWIFVPVYFAANVFTMPEYIRKRFGGQRIRIYLSVLALLLYIFTKISADLFAGAIFIKQALNWNLYASVGALLLIACIFTVAGGLSAVIWTDFIQTLLMVIGAIVLMVLSLIEVGGYHALFEKFEFAQPTTKSHIGYNHLNESCSVPPAEYKHLIRNIKDSELPWLGMTVGLTINSIWYWCADQVIVQRALSAKTVSHAKAGCIFAGYLKLLPLFLLVLPGMASRVLYPDLVACSDPQTCKDICGSENGCTNIAYPLLVIRLMPAGARGMMLSVMLAALMSSLTSIFNSASTIFTIDVWTRIRKQASDVELLIVGRTFVLVLVAISVVWIPIIGESQNSQLFHYINSVTSYLAPPVCAVYLLGISWKRINEPGAFWGLMTGLIIGLTRFIWEFSYSVSACGSGLSETRPDIITKVHYLHFGILLFALSFLVTIVVSLLTPAIDNKHLHRLTFGTRHSKDVREDLHKLDKKKPLEKPANDIVIYSTESSSQLYNASTLTIPSNMQMELKREESPVKNFFFFICGVSSASKLLDSAEAQTQKQTPEEEALSCSELVQEDKTWKKWCHINAVILLAVGLFLYIYYW